MTSRQHGSYLRGRGDRWIRCRRAKVKHPRGGRYQGSWLSRATGGLLAGVGRAPRSGPGRCSRSPPAVVTVADPHPGIPWLHRAPAGSARHSLPLSHWTAPSYGRYSECPASLRRLLVHQATVQGDEHRSCDLLRVWSTNHRRHVPHLLRRSRAGFKK
jgi:hypothetical protein